MLSWTEELVLAVLDAPTTLQTLLGVTVADGFPSHPVR